MLRAMSRDPHAYYESFAINRSDERRQYLASVYGSAVEASARSRAKETASPDQHAAPELQGVTEAA